MEDFPGICFSVCWNQLWQGHSRLSMKKICTNHLLRKLLHYLKAF